MKKFIRGLEIMAPHYPKGMDTEFFFEAEHDVIYFHTTGEQIPADSQEGRELIDLGFYLDTEINVWAKFS